MFKIPFTKFLFWFALLAVLVLSMSPGVAVKVIPASDKVMHFIAFLVLTVLLWSAYKLPKPYITSILILGAFGFAIELLQYFVPYLRFSLLDFAADVAGVVAGGVLYTLLRSRQATA